MLDTFVSTLVYFYIHETLGPIPDCVILFALLCLITLFSSSLLIAVIKHLAKFEEKNNKNNNTHTNYYKFAYLGIKEGANGVY